MINNICEHTHEWHMYTWGTCKCTPNVTDILSVSHSFTLTHSLIRKYSFIYIYTHSLSHSLTHSLILAHTRSFSLIRILTHTRSFLLILTCSFSLTHLFLLTRSCSLTHSLTRSCVREKNSEVKGASCQHKHYMWAGMGRSAAFCIPEVSDCSHCAISSADAHRRPQHSPGRDGDRLQEMTPPTANQGPALESGWRLSRSWPIRLLHRV